MIHATVAGASPTNVGMRAYSAPALLGVLVLGIAACGGDGDGTCDAVANTGCDDGLVCEVVTGGPAACFSPLLVRGVVFDLTDESLIAGARVVALDVNGSPVSSVAVTAADGRYELRIPTERDAEGVPVGVNLTLRADAARYQSFPSGIRQPIPIDTNAATMNGGRYVVESALSSVGLLPLAAAGSGSVWGRVERGPASTGILVVAETGTAPGSGYSAIADTDGDYRIFNLPAGDYTVRAYALESNYTPATITLADAASQEVDLALSATAASNVTGTVNLVEGAPPTSVILVVASTFDAVLARGETPPGLRAPAAGIVPNVDGPWTIAGVPAGRYVALAAFENDGAVRDQSGGGNTDLVFIDVVAGQNLDIVDGFKVTEAIALIGPGATAPESVATAPTLQWDRDSSAKDYHVQVFNALGEITMDHHTNDGAIVSVPYSGALLSGMYYQLRVTSFDDASPTPNPIAKTEDLRGVFFVP